MSAAADPEEVLQAALRPGERVLWAGRADRPFWRWAGGCAFGCLPVTFAVVGLLAFSAYGGFLALRRAVAGNIDTETVRALGFGIWIGGMTIVPAVLYELDLRATRYAITSARALVYSQRGIGEQIDLRDAADPRLWTGLFAFEASGVELRAGGAEGGAPLVFRDLGDARAALAEIRAALAARREPAP